MHRGVGEGGSVGGGVCVDVDGDQGVEGAFRYRQVLRAVLRDVGEVGCGGEGARGVVDGVEAAVGKGEEEEYFCGDLGEGEVG